MNLAIRTAAEGDIPELQELITQGDNYHADHVPEFYRHAAPSRPADLIVRWMESATSDILVAGIGAEVVGLIIVTTQTEPANSENQAHAFAHIKNIVVREDRRGMGIGRVLLGAAERWAGSRGFTEVDLNVWEFNVPAAALYRRQGYEKWSTRMRKKLGQGDKDELRGRRPEQPLRRRNGGIEMDVTIRPAVPKDIPSLQRLFTEVDNYHADHVPAFFRRASAPARPRGIIAQWLEVDDAVILVAEAAGAVVGLVHVTAREAPEHPVLQPRRYAHVSDMVVDAQYRGQGIGGLLLDAAEEWAGKMALPEMELSVWAFNESAAALYRKHGFEVLSMRMGKRLK